MDTQVKTPQTIFLFPQRMMVPLFQRPYVWSEDSQWAPLWADVTRVADRYLQRPYDRHFPHFLGAVVVQQVPANVGALPVHTIIDGQQRLTTLQLLLDALHAQLVAAGQSQPALRIESLIANPEAFRRSAEDAFKVWPTNRDRPAFNEVMGAAPPVAYGELVNRGSRIVEAHQYFSAQVEDWLHLNGPEGVESRAAALDVAVRDLLQLVVIELSADENAQEIFETLNARGTPLTAADLVKNFVFQRLLDEGVDVERAYEAFWREFETGFWEAEVSAGRIRYSRSSIFLNHWLIAQTGEEIVAREVFSRFKTYALYEADAPMSELLRRIHAAAKVYRRLIEATERRTGDLDRVELFAYRTSTMESEVVKPLMLWLLDADLEPVADNQLARALATVEGWLVRRMLVRATTKSYSQVLAELLGEVRKNPRQLVGDVVEDYFRRQSGDSRYWPDDQEVLQEVGALMAYRRLRQGRLRMVLEALEDHARGFRGEVRPFASERVPRARLAIEHVMPVKWATHWPFDGGAAAEQERDRLVHSLGNLTLLTDRLNSKVSNGPWTGPDGKRAALGRHDVLMLNRDLCASAGDVWDDAKIRARTMRMTRSIIEVWPVPEGHVSQVSRVEVRSRRKVRITDLLAAGLLQVGTTLHPRNERLADLVAVVRSDGRIDYDGVAYDSPRAAASAMFGAKRNGWPFFFVDDPAAQRTLRKIKREYLEALDIDDEDDTDDEDDE